MFEHLRPGAKRGHKHISPLLFLYGWFDNGGGNVALSLNYSCQLSRARFMLKPDLGTRRDSKYLLVSVSWKGLEPHQDRPNLHFSNEQSQTGRPRERHENLVKMKQITKELSAACPGMFYYVFLTSGGAAQPLLMCPAS